MANERFDANAERIRRFSELLFAGMEDEETKWEGEGNHNINNSNSRKKKKKGEWEDGEMRKARKKAEGLKTQTEGRNTSVPNEAIVEEGREAIDLSLFITTVSLE